MRSYFLRGGHICAVEILTDASDEAAISQAEALFEKRAREFEGFEVWDRARFVHRHAARPVETASRSSFYRLYLLGQDGSTHGQYDFRAETDEAAREIAQVTFDACSDRAPQFEVWLGSRAVASGTRPATTFEQVSANRQAQVVELEERIRDSKWPVASSKRLLARLANTTAVGKHHVADDRWRVSD